MLFVERQALPGFEFGCTRGLYVLIKSGKEDLSLGIFQLADNFNQREKWVRRRPAVHAGVQVHLRAHGFNFGINQPAQSYAQSRQIGGE